MRRVLSFVLVGWSLVACSPGAAPISQSPHDPSNPSAAEGVSPLAVASAWAMAPPSAASGEVGHEHAHHQGHGSSGPDGHQGHADHGATAPATGHEGHAGHEGHGDAGAPAVTYVCPMHPEVTSSTPGSCPKCNMNLVPKK